jgi:Leucine-rich repeat
MDKKTEITASYLKMVSNKFDTETIFVLNLQSKGISSVGALNECSNVSLLDLTSNSLRDISQLSSLKTLQILKLGKNQISDISSLSGLDQLIHLDLSGNQIKSIKNLAPLKDLPNLNSLVLRTVDGKNNNPCCDEKDYREQVFQTLPKLNRLDGVKKTDKPFTDNVLPEQKKLNFALNIPTTYWYTKEYPKNETKANIVIDDKQLLSGMDDCKAMMKDIENKFKTLGVNF